MSKSTKILLPITILLLIALCINISVSSKKIKSLRYDLYNMADRIDDLENRLDDIQELASDGEAMTEDWYLYSDGYCRTNVSTVFDDCQWQFSRIMDSAEY